MDKISYNNFLDGLDDTYSVGVHGVEGFTNHIVLADNMLKNGLILHNAGGMIQNLQMFGQKGYMGSFLLDKLTNYTYITDFNKDIVNIIVAVPDVLIDGDNTYFLGHFNYSESPNTSEQAGNNLPLNIMTAIEKRIPKEFIYGYTYRKFFSKDNNFGFILNPNFLDNLSEEDRNKFIREYITKLNVKVGVHTIEDEKKIIELRRTAGMFYENEYYRQLLDYLHKEKVKGK